MAIGLGIVLIVVGLVFVLDVVNIDTTAVDTGTLGWILLVAGALAIAISLIVNQQRTRSTTVVEERRDVRPPMYGGDEPSPRPSACRSQCTSAVTSWCAAKARLRIRSMSSGV